MSLKYEVKKKFDLPQGGSVTVTVGSDDPIREEDWMLLRPQAAMEMGTCLIDLAEAMRPTEGVK